VFPNHSGVGSLETYQVSLIAVITFPAKSADVTVHPPHKASYSTGETNKKKRKGEVGENNDHVLSDPQHARFPILFHTSRHQVTVHETLKRECDVLPDLRFCLVSRDTHSERRARVRPDTFYRS